MLARFDVALMDRLDGFVTWLWRMFEIKHLTVIKVAFWIYLVTNLASDAVSARPGHIDWYAVALLLVAFNLYRVVTRTHRRGALAFNTMVMSWRCGPVSTFLRIFAYVTTPVFVAMNIVFAPDWFVASINVASDLGFTAFFLLHQTYLPIGPSRRRLLGHIAFARATA